MLVAIAGGHGQIALRLTRLLAARGRRGPRPDQEPRHAERGTCRGAEPRGLRPRGRVRRSPRRSATPRRSSSPPAPAPGAGEARKRTMDLGGAVKLIEAAPSAGHRSLPDGQRDGRRGSSRPTAADVFGEYLRAKADADRALRESGLDVHDRPPRDAHRRARQPGGSPLGERLEPGSISRDDVAAILAAVLRSSGRRRQELRRRRGADPGRRSRSAAARSAPLVRSSTEILRHPVSERPGNRLQCRELNNR